MTSEESRPMLGRRRPTIAIIADQRERSRMTEPSPSFSKSTGPTDRRKALAVAVACAALIASAAVVMAASPAPSGTGAGASNAPTASEKPHPEGSGQPGRGFFKFFAGRGFAPFAGGGAPFVGLGRGGVEITAIDGSNVSLKTVDGWTRTIAVTSSTKITKGGNAITLDDLAVGQTIRFRQERNSDGSFSVTHIEVVLPTVAGTVTGTTGSTITIRQRDGSSATIHVDASTSFRVQGSKGAASLTDVEVGMGLIAEGEKNADGSLNAARVVAGNADKLRGGHFGPKGGPDKDSGGSPAPSTSPG
jgi:hypothetical protein